MTQDQPTALRLAADLKEFGADSSLARHQAANALHRLHAENEALRAAVTRLHKAKGRYHTQIAAAALYELCGLPAEKVKT